MKKKKLKGKKAKSKKSWSEKLTIKQRQKIFERCKKDLKKLDANLSEEDIFEISKKIINENLLSKTKKEFLEKMKNVSRIEPSRIKQMIEDNSILIKFNTLLSEMVPHVSSLHEMIGMCIKKIQEVGIGENIKNRENKKMQAFQKALSLVIQKQEAGNNMINQQLNANLVKNITLIKNLVMQYVKRKEEERLRLIELQRLEMEKMMREEDAKKLKKQQEINVLDLSFRLNDRSLMKLNEQWDDMNEENKLFTNPQLDGKFFRSFSNMETVIVKKMNKVGEKRNRNKENSKINLEERPRKTEKTE